MVAGILGISRVELDGTGSEIVLKIMLIAGGNNNCGFIWRSSKWALMGTNRVDGGERGRN